MSFDNVMVNGKTAKRNMVLQSAEFAKAVAALGRALSLPEDDITRDASIQRFEFCVELAWKVSKRWLGTDTSAPKQVIREMGQAGLIADVELWLEAIDQRNLSPHTYNEDLAREVDDFASRFLPELQTLETRVHET
jgi:nucleotidyltransferase substrate binding protein (TIGR01987 family)